MEKHLRSVEQDFDHLQKSLLDIVKIAEAKKMTKKLGHGLVYGAFLLGPSVDEEFIKKFALNSFEFWEKISQKDSEYLKKHSTELFPKVPEDYLQELLEIIFNAKVTTDEMLDSIWDILIHMTIAVISYCHHAREPVDGKYTKVFAAGVKISAGRDIFKIRTFD